MASWRETTPQAIQDDLDAVVSTGMDTAFNFLSKSGEFFPFGIEVNDSGELAVTAADMGPGERPQSNAVLANLYAGATNNRGGCQAAGFVADVKASGSDAVRVEAEHRDGGPALVILLAYQRRGLLKKAITRGSMTAAEGERRIWLRQ